MGQLLDGFSAPTRAWFEASFAAPTPAQQGAWAATSAGSSVLVSAPTGSGKTLAAFLAALDELLTDPAGQGTRVLYVSPLKALAYDVDRNLRAPLSGIRRQAQRLGVDVPDVDVGIRTGDTPADERRRLARRPPDILITTPESLYLQLTSKSRSTLAGVQTVIVDEIHAVAGTKRGAHLALSLERLETLAGGGLQRVGLSATQRPLQELAAFLGGGQPAAEGGWHGRPVEIVDAGRDPHLDVEIVVPVDDMSRLGEVVEEPSSGPAAGPPERRRSIWPAVHPRILDLVEAHRSTIVFANSRRLAERLCAALNELHAERLDQRGEEAAGPIARAHHGSVAREHRVDIEQQLKSGALRCVVATSSLELGIDMGAVDLVVQVESPGSVASGLQRIGRAGHHVGEPSVGKVFPKYRGDLLEAAVVVDRMRAGEIEETRYPRNPLDVLAQQVVAMAVMDAWQVDDLLAVVRGAAGFADLSRAQLDGVLDMLSGRYPSDEFAELRPRLNWDRTADVVRARPGAQRLAVTNAGTIPDRGLYGVFIAGEADGGRSYRRVGELDEEMVYETRPGETFTLGSTTWRIEDITRDQVLVVPAPGVPGKLPFWHGDAPGRPVEVGHAVGAFLRGLGGLEPERAAGVLVDRYGLDEKASRNLADYLAEQAETAGSLPTDRRIVIERFRDEVGDWRVCVLSPFGARVHAPWALAIKARARERLGMDVQTMHADDGIVIRLPDAEGEEPAALAETVLIDPDEVEDLVVSELADSALFASRFRECAARALLLPRRVGGQEGIRRTPLWQQRQRSADLLAVASRYGGFPILLETYRECLGDVFDVPGLTELLRAVTSRDVHVTQVATEQASPFASSLLFDYVASYLYDGDAPLAERRAQALSLDRTLLAELLGSDELRELIDPEALDALEAELQRLAAGRRARSSDGVADLLREVGDLTTAEVEERTDGDASAWLGRLEVERRAYRLRVAGEERWAAAEDAARFRDGLGAPPAAGLPDAFLEPVDRPLVDLVARYARTHGPFPPADVASRLGLPEDAVKLALATLEREGRAVQGAFRPHRTHAHPAAREWVDAEVLRRLRRRSLAALRREVEAVEPEALARFLPAWQGVGSPLRGPDRTLEVVEQLQGAPIPASVLERDVLAARVRDYTPAWLDELMATGEVVWVGRGALGAGDGLMALYLRDRAALLAPPPPQPPEGELHARIVARLLERGAAFWPEVYQAAGGGGQQEVLDALWDLVWAGLVTNDSLAPVRALTGSQPGRRAGGRRRERPARAGRRTGPPAGAGRWSAVADIVGDAGATERAAALATQLLERHGVVTRDGVGVEQLVGGFSAVYQVLKTMEESGRARRGYFVEGLGGAQFAFPGAVDRLRGLRQPEEVASAALAATDPANAYGAALRWPEPTGNTGHTPRRVAGAYVVLSGGVLLGYLERGARSLLTFADDDASLATVADGLAGLVAAGTVRAIRLQRIDGAEATDHPLLAHLRERGFADHPRGLVLRA